MKKLQKPLTLVVTACGRHKNGKPMPAGELYKSPRIRAVRNRVEKYDFADFAILSAKYGLVNAQERVAPYEQIMTSQRSKQLVPQILAKVRDYKCIVCFKAGARKEYFDCLFEACRVAQKILIVLGYANMGGINELTSVMDRLRDGEFPGSEIAVDVLK